MASVDRDIMRQEESINGDRIESTAHCCSSFMEQVLGKENLIQALNQVTRNKGAPGIDNISVDVFPDFLKRHWPVIREKLKEGRYYPNPVKRVEIPKGDGGKRQLGIPTVIDRFIQQAIAQVLQALWDESFHDNSYGFRPGRNAHQAIGHVQACIQQDNDYVVDCDLSSFFDTVNHDRLMVRLKQRLADPLALTLIHRILKAPVSIDGELQANVVGVPQGGPLSPILSNIVLDELDWELEKRGHHFARYADDFVIMVRSREAGERVMESLQHYLSDSLKLTVNTQKSAVGRPWERTFLGFTFSRHRGFKIKVSEKAILKLKSKVRLLTRRTRGRTIYYVIEELKRSLLGWKAYFDISEVLSPLRDIDKWIRRKLRCYLLKQWGRAGYRMLRRLGVKRVLAWNTAKSARGPWRLSKSPALVQALPNRYFKDLGLPELAAR